MHGRSELLLQANRAYRRFLLSIVDGSPFFPLSIRTGKSNRPGGYADLKAELAEFRAAAETLGLHVEWREVNDPRFGMYERPEQACFADEESYLRAIGKVEEGRRFRMDVELLRAALPDADAWVRENIQAVIDRHGRWSKLLRVVQWFREQPRPGIYLRQIPVESVDTKFFEENEQVLDSLLTHAQPGAVTLDAKTFEERHGLLLVEKLIRFRFLDEALQRREGFPVPDVSVPVSDFRRLQITPPQVIVTESLRNFLALPATQGAVAVFGGGNAASLLAGADWLHTPRLWYWGDIDPWGFDILGRLRAEFPQTESLLMDAATFEAHRKLWATMPPANLKLPAHLTDEERSTFEEVVAVRMRLEQERIPFHAVEEALGRIHAV